MTCKLMSLCPVSSDVCKNVRCASDCKCYAAVMNAFESLVDGPYSVAFDAALRIYRYHYPNDNKNTAKLTVERWVNAAHMQ